MRRSATRSPASRAELRRTEPPALPELSQPQVLRHYLRLSQETFGNDVDIHLGLGTCTMKYSPKVNEELVRSANVADLHPLQDDETVQGMLEILYRFERMLCEISGMSRFTFQPAGGSQAVYANARMMRAYHEARGEGAPGRDRDHDLLPSLRRRRPRDGRLQGDHGVRRRHGAIPSPTRSRRRCRSGPPGS